MVCLDKQQEQLIDRRLFSSGMKLYTVGSNRFGQLKGPRGGELKASGASSGGGATMDPLIPASVDLMVSQPVCRVVACDTFTVAVTEGKY